jgi:hypothetical protein
MIQYAKVSPTATVQTIASAAHPQYGVGAKDDRCLQDAQPRLTGATRREMAHG